MNMLIFYKKKMGMVKLPLFHMHCITTDIKKKDGFTQQNYLST